MFSTWFVVLFVLAGSINALPSAKDASTSPVTPPQPPITTNLPDTTLKPISTPTTRRTMSTPGVSSTNKPGIIRVPLKSSRIRPTNSTTASGKTEVIKGWEKMEKGFKKLIDGVIKAIMPVFIEASSKTEVSGLCMNSLMEFVSGLRKMKPWAYRMLDAYGKPGGGILEGTVTAFGSYDECVNIDVLDRSKRPKFSGRYCLLELRPPLPPKPQFYTIHHFLSDFANYSKKPTVMADISRYAHFLLFMSYRIAVCVPSTCTQQDVSNAINYFAEDYALNATVSHCETKSEVPMTSVQISATAIFSLIAILIIIGSFLDLVERNIDNKNYLNHLRSLPLRLVMAFSIFKTCEKLLSPSTSLGDDRAIHGIRSITLIWIIAGYLFLHLEYQLFRDSLRAIEFSKQFAFQAVINSSLGFETLFLVSGFLLGRSWFSQEVSCIPKKMISMLANYILKVVPLYAMVILTVFLLPLAGNGPLWTQGSQLFTESCTSNWWTNFLFINNFAVDSSNRCLENSWLLSCELQLMILGTIVIVFIKKSKMGHIMNGVILFTSVLVIVLMTLIHGLPPGILFAQADIKQRNVVEDLLFYKPYPHMGALSIGIGLAHFLQSFQLHRLKKTTLALGWVIALICTTTSVFGIYEWNMAEQLSPSATSVLYAAGHRLGWSAGVAWLVYVASTGQAGVVATLLSWPPFGVVSRVFVGTYLLHPVIVRFALLYMRERLQASQIIAGMLFIGVIVVSLILAIGAHLFSSVPLQIIKNSSASPPSSSCEDLLAEKKMAAMKYENTACNIKL